MTDIQAALVLSQLQRLDDYIARRHALAERYSQALAELPLLKPYRDPKQRSALHLYLFQVTDGSTRAITLQALREAGIGVNVHYIPVHTQPTTGGSALPPAIILSRKPIMSAPSVCRCFQPSASWSKIRSSPPSDTALDNTAITRNSHDESLILKADF